MRITLIPFTAVRSSERSDLDVKDLFRRPYGRHIMVGLCLLGLPYALAQAPAPILRFEVASVKAHIFTAGDRSDFAISDNRVNFSVASVYALIREAYDVKMDRISGGPAWASRVRDAAFDIVANTEGASTKDQVRVMLQQLLADRFQLKIHLESKEVDIYQLVIAKGGSKVVQSVALATDKVNVATRTISTGLIAREISSEKMSMATLADSIAASTGRSVVDRTGLAGDYSLAISWTEDNWVAGNQPSIEVSGPSIFTALEEQLGLKLEYAKGQGKFLTIDSVEKPSAN